MHRLSLYLFKSETPPGISWILSSRSFFNECILIRFKGKLGFFNMFRVLSVSTNWRGSKASIPCTKLFIFTHSYLNPLIRFQDKVSFTRHEDTPLLFIISHFTTTREEKICENCKYVNRKHIQDWQLVLFLPNCKEIKSWLVSFIPQTEAMVQKLPCRENVTTAKSQLRGLLKGFFSSCLFSRSFEMEPCTEGALSPCFSDSNFVMGTFQILLPAGLLLGSIIVVSFCLKFCDLCIGIIVVLCWVEPCHNYQQRPLIFSYQKKARWQSSLHGSISKLLEKR